MTYLSRRKFLLTSLVTLALPKKIECAEGEPLRFGIVSDAHYADVDARGSRFYRESREKMIECVQRMNEQGVKFLVELGDLKDEGTPPQETETLRFLDEIESELAKFNGPRYYVLGNHDVDSISKEQFLSRVQIHGLSTPRSYYSFDDSGIHFVVLDACYRSDGSDYDHGNFVWTDANIPQEELEWLQDDLENTQRPTILLMHQLLDGEGDVYVKNAAAVRSVLEGSSKVFAVFQGHHHPGQYNQIAGIHYYTLKGMVEGAGMENNAYAIVHVYTDRITIEGYRRAVSKQLPKV